LALCKAGSSLDFWRPQAPGALVWAALAAGAPLVASFSPDSLPSGAPHYAVR